MGRAGSWTVMALTALWAVLGSPDRELFAKPARPRTPRCTREVIGSLTAHVPSVEVQPQFRLNGKPFPLAGKSAGVFTLWASQPTDLFDGPQVSLGRTDEPPQSVRVVPGVYDVYYSWLSGTGVPRNQLARVRRKVNLRKDGVLTIDVPMVQVSGFKRHNGVAFPDDQSVAELSLLGDDGRNEVRLGGTLPSEFSVRIIPGSYSFRYDWGAGRTIPRNRHATVRSLRLPTDSADLVLNVPSVRQDFAFLHNGEEFWPADFDYGNIVLTRPDREEVPIGATYAPPPPVRLIPGTYDVHWRYAAGAQVPRNEDSKFRVGLVVEGSPVVIDVPSVEISGDIRVNGEVPPDSAIENGRLSLTMPDTKDRVDVGATRWGAYQVRVVPGVYDVAYDYIAGASIMPANTGATLVEGWEVAAEPHRTLDVPVGVYEGVFFLNGEPFPFSDFESGSLYVLPLTGGGDPVRLGSTTYGAFLRRLLPGVYQTAYAHVAGASIVPANTLTTFGPTKQVFQGEGATVGDILDVRAGTLRVGYEHNGVPVPEGGPQNATLYLHRGDNHLQLHDVIWGPAAQRIAMEGRFHLLYQYREGPDLPQNVMMPIGCWDLVR